MLRPEINWERCHCCEPCWARIVCRPRAILKFDPGDPAVIEYSRCNGCGLCVLECPFDAIIMKDTSVSTGSLNGCLPFR